MKTLIHKFFLVIMLVFVANASHGQALIKSDSAIIMGIIDQFKDSPSHSLRHDGSLLLAIGKRLVGTPYVGKTLDRNTREQLVINIRELDCTTFVENAVAIFLCIKNNRTAFSDFTSYLRSIRYADGIVAYENRLHYFMSWIDNAEKHNIAHEVHSAYIPFAGYKTLDISYMSRHPALYPMMSGNSDLISKIKATERELTGRKQRYIPKKDLRKFTDHDSIRDGDIIVIVTNKQGLDTSHIGIACWQNNTLHLLNASSIHKKVVVEPMTLYEYMLRHPSQAGIRVVRLATE